jgi:HEPN domain-containing protein
MNRNDLQQLADLRIREANILFAAGEYSGAYYLAGYAVECALKACFAKNVKQYDFPEKGRTDKVFIHDLKELLKHAGLKDQLDADLKKNVGLAASWEEVVKWSEASRYFFWTKNQTEEILAAILEGKDGVMPWIKQRW